MKNRVEGGAEVLNYMEDMKASMTSLETAETLHEIVKNYALLVGMVINAKKSAIQLNIETPLKSPFRRSQEWTRRHTGILGLR